MKKKRILSAGIILGTTALLLSACGNQQQNQENRLYIGVTYYNQSDTFLNEMLDSFKAQLEEMEVGGTVPAVTVRDAAGLQKTQTDQVKELIDAGCNVLCVNLVDRADPSDIIDLAREYDVPIIFFNREPVAEDLMQWDRLYYVGADAKQSGVMQGELAADEIWENEQIDRNKDGKIQYVVLEGEAGHQDSVIRTENSVNTLQQKGIALEKLSYEIANWNRAQAENRMEQMIGQYQTSIELVLANNDDMALGAIDAYEKLNYSETSRPVIFGIDGTDDGLKAIRDSKLTGTVYNDKEGQAEMMAKLAAALVSGEGMEDLPFENDRYLMVPYFKVTPQNIEELLGEENISPEANERG